MSQAIDIPTPGQRRADQAIYAALRLWPGVVGQVLADEIRYGYRLLPWLGPNSRCVRLIDYLLDQPEEAAPAPN